MWDWDTIALPISEIPLQPAVPLPEIVATPSFIPELTSSETSPPVETLSQHSPTVPVPAETLSQHSPTVLVPATRADPTVPNQQKLQVYSWKKSSQGNKPLMSTVHYPESEPMLGTGSSSSSNPETISNRLDEPIALRKGVRSCTQHPISKFVSYDNLSPLFHAFTTNLSRIDVPGTIEDALAVPEWKNAVLEEMRALEKNDTWSLVELPQGKGVIECKRVFTVKVRPNGSIERYKA